MGTLEDAVRQIQSAHERSAPAGTLPIRELTQLERLAGCTFRPGDVVRDPVTGQEATVVRSRHVRYNYPPEQG